MNGFGPISRCTLAHIASSGRNDISVDKVNATGLIETAAHLIRYDSVHGRYPGEIKVGERSMDLGRSPIEMYSTYDPGELDWTGCDVVLECTGKFNDGEKSKVHLDQGAGSGLSERATSQRDQVTNSITIGLGVLILGALAVHITVFGTEHLVFIGKNLTDLIDWIAFWC